MMLVTKTLATRDEALAADARDEEPGAKPATEGAVVVAGQ